MVQIIKNKAKIMTEIEIMEQVEAFVALPRSERKDKFFKLDPEVRKRARAIIEKRRGIAYRTSDGDMVLTPEAYDAEIERLEGKKADLEGKAVAIDNKIAELKNKKAIYHSN